MSISQNEAGFSDVQKQYLQGFFVGAKIGPIGFGDVDAVATNVALPAEEEPEWTKEELIKRKDHPFNAIEKLVVDARTNAAPEGEFVFRHKWNGLFWLNPVKDGYMCRLRIPGGTVKSYQLRELAAMSRELTTGYIQITNRNNFQLRLIAPKDCPEFLRRVQGCGLHSRGAGADNIRNITMNPCAGYDPYEIIDVRPLVAELSQRITNSLEFYDLPRKFNIAFDGGGLVSSVEDTNDIGASAVEITENALGLAPGVYFKIALGGVTGHQKFAKDCGVLVSPTELVDCIQALVRVFIKHGDRTDRKKARFCYVLQNLGETTVLSEAEALLGKPFIHVAGRDFGAQPRKFSQQGHSHVGSYPQKQENLYYVGAHVPVGQMTDAQLDAVAQLSDEFGSGEIRLTVWQNFIIPNVLAERVAALEAALKFVGFPTNTSPLRNGFVACTGNRYCKFAATDTKGHAVAMMQYLESRVALDRPVNVHFTGCAHSCAQHFMGDIGLLGTKAKGPSGEGYHITVGGGFGENRKIGRQVFTGVPVESLGLTLEAMLRTYLEHRSNAAEEFHGFCNRYEIAELQTLFEKTASQCQ